MLGISLLSAAAFLALLGRYVARPSQPLMVALAGLGLGVANALAPYLGLQLETLDPRAPFGLTAPALASVTLGMVAAERALAFQWHHAVSSPALALRPAAASDLPTLLPLFWIGFNPSLLTAGMLTRRLGAPATMAIGAELALGATGREGLMSGALWATLAGAALLALNAVRR